MYKIGELSHVRGSPIVCKHADSTEEKIAATDSVRRIHLEEFAERGMSFEFDKEAWIHNFEKTRDCLCILSPSAQDT